jgi:alpha-beta hydrolase superfamily lysophospholipase
MTSSPKPTVVVIHGAWHGPEHLTPLAKFFDEHGYATSCVQHPSVGNSAEVGLKDDAEVVRKNIADLVEVQNKELIVIAHSYGGMVMSEALTADLGKASRSKAGKTGGIIRIVYLTAFLVPLGESLMTTLPPPSADKPNTLILDVR